LLKDVDRLDNHLRQTHKIKDKVERKMYLSKATVAKVELPSLPYLSEQSDESEDKIETFNDFKKCLKDFGVDEIARKRRCHRNGGVERSTGEA